MTGPELLTAAITAMIVILPLVVLDRSRRRERALRLIAQGAADGSQRMTASGKGPRRGEDLAAALARALDEAERWESLPFAGRPPDTVRNLGSCRAEIEEVISLAQSEGAGQAGLALLELSLLGGYSSPVYVTDARTLRERFWRIRYLLAHERP